MLFPRYAAIELGHTNYQELGDLNWEPKALPYTGDPIANGVALHDRSSQELTDSTDASA